MLKYQAINCLLDAQYRIERSKYPWTKDENYDPASDQLALWTLGQQASSESQENFDQMIQAGRQHGAEYLVIKPNIIQFVGRDLEGELIEQQLTPLEFKEEQRNYICRDDPDSARYITFEWNHDQTDQGRLMRLQFYKLQYVDTAQVRGVYHVLSGRRETNRRHIIEEFWRLGFAAWRGRPLHVAQPKWSGTREDLQEMTDMAAKYWARRNSSDVAHKMVAAYRSINRYAAWPGNW